MTTCCIQLREASGHLEQDIFGEAEEQGIRERRGQTGKGLRPGPHGLVPQLQLCISWLAGCCLLVTATRTLFKL